jgi:hypothetical protein
VTQQFGQSFAIAVIRHFMGRGQLGPFMWAFLGTLPGRAED